MEKGLGKETMRFGLSVIFRIIGVDTGRYADELWQLFCICTVVFPTEILEQTFMTSPYDVTRFSHVIEGGNYKREYD